MARFRFHRLASLIVLAASAAWVLTGEFSSVGSAAEGKDGNDGKTPEAKPAETVKPPRTVSAIVVPQVDHRLTIRVSGTTASDKRAELATRSAGTISSLPHKQGDTIKAGDVILAMDSAEKKIAVDAAQQVLTQRQAEANATSRLAKAGNVAKLQLDAAMSALHGAQSALEAAKAELERTEVIAPFDGVIDKVNVENSAAVSQGMVVATLISLDPIIAVGEISERNLSSIKIGSPASVRLVSGATAEGTVRYISREASAATRTYRIEVAIDNKDGAIPSGMTAEINVKSDPIKAIKLPRSAVTLNGEGTLGVRAVDKDNKALFLPVDLIDDATNAIVLTGVPDGTKIIISGQDFVADGELLNVVEPDAETLKKLAAQFADELK